MPELAIITVSYNTRQLLRACLDSLQADLERSALESEIWVVDNGSSDGSAVMVRERFPRARLIVSDQNLGFAAGNNLALNALLQGTQHATGSTEHVLLLNPDTTVQPGALGTLVAFMGQHPDAGMAGVQLRYPDGGFQHSAFHFPTLSQVLLDFFPLHHRLINSRLNGRYPRAWTEDGEPFAIDHPLGAAMMVRWEAIQEVGLLDESFFMYCEEIDWCWRMKQAGWRIYCVPRSVITHHEAQSTRQFRDEMFVQLWRSRFRLFRKHYTPLFRWTARQLVWLGAGAEMKRARRAHMRDQLLPEAYQKRVEALRRVRQMR
jgi:N-acetylglucosaminyl-diphospho-decaprenol L-rhamnosyltransferase